MILQVLNQLYNLLRSTLGEGNVSSLPAKELLYFFVQKYYFCCQESQSDSLHFVEIIANLKTLNVKMTVKGQNDNATHVGDLLENALASLFS